MKTSTLDEEIIREKEEMKKSQKIRKERNKKQELFL